jgi:hypothetical protein
MMEMDPVFAEEVEEADDSLAKDGCDCSAGIGGFFAHQAARGEMKKVLAAVEMNELETLKLSVRPTRKEVVRLCQLLADNESISRADLFGLRLDDADCEHVATLCKRSQKLVYLNLLGSRFSSEAAERVMASCKARMRVRTVCGYENDPVLDLEGQRLADVDAVLLT